MNLEKRTELTLKHLDAYQHHWNILKSAGFILVGAAIIIVQFFTFSRLYHDSDSNRLLLRCTLTASLTNQPATKIRDDINKCLEETK